MYPIILSEVINKTKRAINALAASAHLIFRWARIYNLAFVTATELKNSLQREVTSEKIGELVLHKLKEIDDVAYIRFASVYRDFNDVDSFMRIISELKDDKNK